MKLTLFALLLLLSCVLPAQAQTKSLVVPRAFTSTDNTLPRFNGTSGQLIQASGVTLSDANDLTGINSIVIGGTNLIGAIAGKQAAGDYITALTGDATASGPGSAVLTIAANAVALTTDTTGNYAAGDAEAGAALTGDSATAFFSTGTIEIARLATGTPDGTKFIRDDGTLAVPPGAAGGDSITVDGSATVDPNFSDAGDIDYTYSSPNITGTVKADAITLAKMADMATASFLGRNTAATGDPEVLSVATAKTMLNLSGSNTGDQTITLTGDVTGSGTGSFAATIADNAVDGTDIALGSDAQGDVMYYDGSNWVRLAAGTSGHFLKTQGVGANPMWDAGGSATPGGSDTQVQFNDGGVFGGDAGFTYNKTTDTITVGTLTTTTFNATTLNLTNPLSLASGGTGAALADPNDDRILFWDDSAGAVAFGDPVALDVDFTTTTFGFSRTATLAGNPSLAASHATFATTGIIFEGATANTVEGLLAAEDVSGSDVTWTLPDRSGTIAVSGDTLTGDVSATLESDGSTATTIADNSVDGTDIAITSQAAGDIMYYDGTDWIRLAKGTAGQVLEMNAGATAPEWDADDGGSGSPTTTRGDLIVRGAAADERLAIGLIGSALVSDGVDLVWSTIRTVVRYESEFSSSILSGGEHFATGTSGSGTAVVGTSDATHPGVWSLSTAGSATGSGIINTANAAVLFGGGAITAGWLIQTPSSLSDGTETYVIRAGFSDINGSDTTDGAYFEYDQAASTAWRFCTANNSTRSKSNSATTVAVSTWYWLQIAVNAAGTQVDFFINGTNVGNQTANIPTAAGRETGMRCYILKSAGTTARTILVDYANYFQVVTANRY